MLFWIMEEVMHTFNKSNKLYNVSYDIRGEVVSTASKMLENGEDILMLNIGNLTPFDFPPPNNLINAVRENLIHSAGYGNAKGLLAAREAIVSYNKTKNIEVEKEDIYIGNGVSELISIAMTAFLNENDEILVPSPDYPLWTAAVTLGSGRPVSYICEEEDGWNPNISDIKSKINERTKGIVVINPNNPTGALYPKEILEEIVKIAKENNLLIFADEIYDRLVMDGKKHISIASIDKELPVITFNGLSKSHLVAGFRAGWMSISGDKKRMKSYIEGIDQLAEMRLCSNIPAQMMIETAISDINFSESFMGKDKRIHKQREFIYEAINNIDGLSSTYPSAAFYLFVKMDVEKFNIKSDEKMALDLLKEKHILVTHGSGFNWKKPDHFRLVYLPQMEVLKEAASKMKDFFNGYYQL